MTILEAIIDDELPHFAKWLEDYDPPRGGHDWAGSLRCV